MRVIRTKLLSLRNCLKLSNGYIFPFLLTFLRTLIFFRMLFDMGCIYLLLFVRINNIYIILTKSNIYIYFWKCKWVIVTSEGGHSYEIW